MTANTEVAERLAVALVELRQLQRQHRFGAAEAVHIRVGLLVRMLLDVEPTVEGAQPICAADWRGISNGMPPGRVAKKVARMCCLCGSVTHAGIFINVGDPERVPYPTAN